MLNYRLCTGYDAGHVIGHDGAYHCYKTVEMRGFYFTC